MLRGERLVQAWASDLAHGGGGLFCSSAGAALRPRVGERYGARRHDDDLGPRSQSGDIDGDAGSLGVPVAPFPRAGPADLTTMRRAPANAGPTAASLLVPLVIPPRPPTPATGALLHASGTPGAA
jgi:hypothetical protein